MSKMPARNDSSERESLENQIDRLNNKIFEFMNNSLLNCTELEQSEAVRESVPKRTFDETEFMNTDKFMITDDNEELYADYIRCCMKLEDYRSEALRNQDICDFDFSEIRSSVGGEKVRSSLGDFNRKSEEYKDVSIKDLYLLLTSVKSVIAQVESGENYSGVLKFAGTMFTLNIFGMEVPEKDKCLEQIAKKNENLELKVNQLQNELIELKKKLSIPNEVINRFCDKIETQMLTTFNEAVHPRPIFTDHKILQKNLFDNKSWALLEYNYKKLRLHHKNCKKITYNLQWQSAEVELLKAQLQKKFRDNIEKEAELNYRNQEILKLEDMYNEKIKKVEDNKSDLNLEIMKIDKYKKKLEKLKVIIKHQMESLKGLNSPKEETRRPRSARAFDNSPTIKRIRNNSANSDNLDNEIEETQRAISEIESSLQESSDESKSVKLSSLYTKLSNLRTQQALDKSNSTSDTMQNMINSFAKNRNNNMLVPKKFTFSSSENSPDCTPIKITTCSPRENSTDTAKPPIYRRPNRGATELLPARGAREAYPRGSVEGTPTGSNNRNANIRLREERLAEREAELDMKEKELQNTWMKIPNAQALIPMVQNEILNLRKIQHEYDRKINNLQNADDCRSDKEEKVKGGGDETVCVEAQMKKLKGLYKLMEDLLA